MSVKCPIYLVTGFLGSGKSSFVNALLSQEAAHHRVAVIENEFAELGIDGEELLRRHNFLLVEINIGSIFCVCQYSNFKEVLQGIRDEYDPDIIVVETTGVADPIAIAQLMEDEYIASNFYLELIVTLVDAVRFLTVGQALLSITHQIKVADVLLINKVDGVGADVIDSIKTKLLELNPFAAQCETVEGWVDVSHLRLRSTQRPKIKGELTTADQSNLFTRVYKSTKSLRMDSVKSFFRELPPSIYRVKGYLYIDKSHYMVQYVAEELKLTEVGCAGHYNELIAIGSEMIIFRAIEY